jgi:rod shape-determining protein MreB and related proteins
MDKLFLNKINFIKKLKKLKWLEKFSPIIGIDLGTVNSLVYVSGKGIVINEPSVVAINKKTGKILAVGKNAKKMIGKTPPNISAVEPLVDGVISDFEVTEQMVKYFINKVNDQVVHSFSRPRVVVAIPMSATLVEQKSALDAVKNAGASEVYLIYEPVAATVGARLPIKNATGHFVVDIGGGTTEIAAISLGGIVTQKSIRIAGNRLNKDIVQFAREKLNLLIGEPSAERVKISLGSAIKPEERLEGFLRGRDLIDGLPREILISDEHVRKAISKSIDSLVSNIRSVMEEVPPELLPDIMKQGIILTGGGALLRGLDKAIEEDTQVKVRISEDPLTAVARGAGKVLENMEEYKELLVDF